MQPTNQISVWMEKDRFIKGMFYFHKIYLTVIKFYVILSSSNKLEENNI